MWLRDRLFQVVFPCSLGPWPSDCWGPASSAQSPATSPRLPWQTWCRVEIRGVSWVAMGYLTTDLCDVHGMLMGKQWNSAIFAQAQMHRSAPKWIYQLTPLRMFGNFSGWRSNAGGRSSLDSLDGWILGS